MIIDTDRTEHRYNINNEAVFKTVHIKNVRTLPVLWDTFTSASNI